MARIHIRNISKRRLSYLVVAVLFLLAILSGRQMGLGKNSSNSDASTSTTAEAEAKSAGTPATGANTNPVEVVTTQTIPSAANSVLQKKCLTA